MNFEAAAATAEVGRKPGFGPLSGGVIACLIAALWTVGATIGITFPTAETPPPDSSSSLAFQAGAVARAPLMAAIVVLVLSWATFWRLPSVRSALFGLAILIAVGCVVAVPVRLSLAAALNDEERTAVSLIQSTTLQVEEIVSAAREQAHEIGLGPDVPQSTWTRELVAARLDQIEQALPIARAAMERLDRVRQTSTAAITNSALSENTRTQVTRQLEWVIGNSPSVVEGFRAELLVLEKSEEQFSYLADNPFGWDVQDGQIAFRSERVFRRFNQLGEQQSSLAAAMNEATQAMRTRRQSTLESSPFNSTPGLLESLSRSSVDQVKQVSSWSYLVLMRTMMGVVGAVVLALLAAPIMKVSAQSIAWNRILVVAFRSSLPALLGISLTYAVYVDILGRRAFETPAMLLLAWLVLAGWLMSLGMKREGVVRRFPGIGTRVIVGVFVFSWMFAGLAYVLGLLVWPT